MSRRWRTSTFGSATMKLWTFRLRGLLVRKRPGQKVPWLKTVLLATQNGILGGLGNPEFEDPLGRDL
jgi:hypothetical protein